MKTDPLDELEKGALEKDALWELLNQAPPPQASPSFTQNVLRAARLGNAHKQRSWGNFLSPLSIGIPALAAVIVGLVFISTQNPSSDASSLTSAAPSMQNTSSSLTQSSSQASEQEWIDEALLSTALEQPDLFTDEELVAMIF